MGPISWVLFIKKYIFMKKIIFPFTQVINQNLEMWPSSIILSHTTMSLGLQDLCISLPHYINEIWKKYKLIQSDLYQSGDGTIVNWYIIILKSAINFQRIPSEYCFLNKTNTRMKQLILNSLFPPKITDVFDYGNQVFFYNALTIRGTLKYYLPQNRRRLPWKNSIYTCMPSSKEKCQIHLFQWICLIIGQEFHTPCFLNKLSWKEFI
jgi:hypothetical protein